MNTKLISQPALDTIDQYLHFKVGGAECAVPYFNNKKSAQRAALRALVGKGSPKEISDEVGILGIQKKIGPKDWTNDLLKKFMCDNDIGIDCSGFAYHVLDAESKERGYGPIDKHIVFQNRSFFRHMIAKLRPAENTDVLAFADDKNSVPVNLSKIEPGDFITMTGTETARNHIVIVHSIDYEGSVTIAIHYTHSIAWPDDGQYDHGVRQGIIEILDPAKSLSDQKWTEKEKTGAENPTFMRAKIAKTEIRRIRWWK